MAIHKDCGLLTYIDATPSEQLNSISDDSMVLVLTGLTCVQDEGVAGLKQFKDTNFEDRHTEAMRIVECLEEGTITLQTFSIIARYKSIERYALAKEQELSGVLTRVGNSYETDGERMGANVALAMIWYAVALNFIGLQFANYIKNSDVERVTLIPDPLPSDPRKAMDIVKKVTFNSELGALWQDTIKATGSKFTIGYLGSYREKEGEPSLPGKEHPHSILADWISHSLCASFEDNQEYFINKHPDRTDEEKEIYLENIKKPWFWLYENNRGLFLSLERLITESEKSAGELSSDTL